MNNNQNDPYSEETNNKPKGRQEKEIRNQGMALGDNPEDVWSKTRKACQVAITKTLEKFTDTEQIKEYKKDQTDDDLSSRIKEIAENYDNLLFEPHKLDFNGYKERFRKDLIALRNKETDFAVNLITGDLTIKQFSEFDEHDLISKKQKIENKQLLDKELKKSISKNTITIENINEMKNQNTFVGEKWGISESAAKIDNEFDNE